MNPFVYEMPTKMIFGENCVFAQKQVLQQLGKKAFIVTGKSSAKNGALQDMEKALQATEIAYDIFQSVEENPSVEMVEAAAKQGIQSDVDFVIGIGGGSPMDASKAIAALIGTPGSSGKALYDTTKIFQPLPVVAVPTTAGTGSETTPYSILTLHDEQTKRSIPLKIFPRVAFLDAKYMDQLPVGITINTAIDALSHLIESYLCARANFMSDLLVEDGFRIFACCVDGIKQKQFPREIRENLLLASSIAGMCIAQTGTSLPHGMGYALTYFKNIPHGRANGIIMRQYFALCQDQNRLDKMAKLCGFTDINALCDFIEGVLETEETFTEDEIRLYTEQFLSNTEKLKSHPAPLTKEDILLVYKNSLKTV